MQIPLKKKERLESLIGLSRNGLAGDMRIAQLCSKLEISSSAVSQVRRPPTVSH